MMRLFLVGCVSLIAVGVIGLACAQSLPAQTARFETAQFEQPAIQISWMQSSARPRWGGGQ